MNAEAFERRQGSRAGARRLGIGWVFVVVGNLYGVEVEALRGANRGDARVAFARQLAMYLMHTVYKLSLTRVGAAFGRDRTTASHGVHVVEDMREDPLFDRQLAILENLLRHAVKFETIPFEAAA